MMIFFSRIIYRAIWWLIAIFAVIRLFWLSRKEAGYRANIAERFAWHLKLPNRSKNNAFVIWIHAVSVGETVAIQILVKELLDQFPTAKIVLTHMTPAGRSRSKQLFQDHRCEIMYLPYDLTYAMRRFLKYYQPCLGIMVETEIWPTLLHEAKELDIPIILINARKSLRSYQKALKWGALTRATYQLLSNVFAQTEVDAERIADLGAKSVSVMGNLKFDVQLPKELIALGQAWRKSFPLRPIWVAASTHEGEEEILLDALSQIDLPNILLIIVPRHIKRFLQVEQLLIRRKINYVKRSQLFPDYLEASSKVKHSTETAQVLLGDSMGELFAYYAMSDIAFVGGSLKPFGGHNLIEATALGLPVLMGPYVFNMSKIMKTAKASKAALQVEGADEIARTVHNILEDSQRYQTMSQAALSFSRNYEGVTKRLVTQLIPYIHHKKTF